MIPKSSRLSRRNVLKSTGAAATAAVAGCLGDSSDQGQADEDETGTINVGGVAPFDLGDWSPFTEETGWGVDYVTISNSPGTLFSTLLSGGGRDLYDLFGVVGGFQQPLVENDLIQKPDQSRLSNLEDQYGFWQDPEAARFFEYDGEMYGVPILWQGDSMAYLPDETGEVTSYEALFSEEFEGQTAIEDNYTTAGQKTALYLKENNMADIDNIWNMTPDEIETVVDFLIEKKEEGQFRTIWSGFENAVNLMSNNEVVVMDTWEPVVFSLQDDGVDAKYAEPDEGYLLWADVNYIIAPSEERPSAEEQAVYDLIDFQLGGHYGAEVTLQTGYATTPLAIDYAEQRDDLDSDEVQNIHDRVRHKFEDVGGVWQQRWPDHREAYEEQWQRLRNA